MSKYHKTEGGLWVNTEKSKANQPDRTGTLAVSREQLKGLIAMGKKGETVKIKIAAWDRKAQDTGQPYQYVTGEVYWDGEAESAPPPPPPQPEPVAAGEDDWPF
jgi:hypothetical protein